MRPRYNLSKGHCCLACLPVTSVCYGAENVNTPSCRQRSIYQQWQMLMEAPLLIDGHTPAAAGNENMLGTEPPAPYPHSDRNMPHLAERLRRANSRSFQDPGYHHVAGLCFRLCMLATAPRREKSTRAPLLMEYSKLLTPLVMSGTFSGVPGSFTPLSLPIASATSTSNEACAVLVRLQSLDYRTRLPQPYITRVATWTLRMPVLHSAISKM